MRDHTVFAVVLLVFAIGFYSFTSGSLTGQMFGVYTVGEYYDGPVTTAKGVDFWSDNNYPLLGNPLRVNSMYEGEIKSTRAIIQLCIERALQSSHQASFRAAELYFKHTGVCTGVNPKDLDVDGDGLLTRNDIRIAYAHYSKSGYTKIQKNEINKLLLCSASNEGKRIWSGAYKKYLECTNLKGYPGFMFLNMDLFGYV